MPHYAIAINGRTRRVDVSTEGGVLVTVDDRTWRVDAARVNSHTWSLMVAADADGELAAGASSSCEITVTPDGTPGTMIVYVGATPVQVAIEGRGAFGRRRQTSSGGSAQHVTAPMPGKVVRVLVAAGDRVRARQPLIVVEAMKMENELRAEGDGTVKAVPVREGQSVDSGTLLVAIE